MKKTIPENSLKTHQRPFSLDEFFQSDEPGALSWLNLDVNELNSDSPLNEEDERTTIVVHFDCAKWKNQGVPCHINCGECGNSSEQK